MHPVHEARAHEHKHAMAHLKRAGYKHGGSVESDEASDKMLVRRAVRQHEKHDHKGEKLTDLKLRKGGKVEGHKTRARHDRRARGGGIKHRDDGGSVDATKQLGDRPTQQEFQTLKNSYPNASDSAITNAVKLLGQREPASTYKTMFGQKRGGSVRHKYADGGHVKHHGGKSPGKINIVIATGGGASERQQAMQQGMQVGARLAAGAARPPMAAPAGPPPVPPRPPMAGPPGMAPGMGAPPMAGPPGLPPGMPPRPGMKRGGRTRMHDEWEESPQHEKRGGHVKRQMGGYTPAPMPARPMVGAAAPGMMQRTPMNRGGFALKDAGAGGAKGRMEKEKAYGHGGATHVKVRGHMRRKAGGRIERDCD